MGNLCSRCCPRLDGKRASDEQIMGAQNHDPPLLEDLVWEILKWLPVKSLMRFKCVSRTWLSIVTDPSFAGAHRGGGGGRRGLLVPLVPSSSLRLLKNRYFLCVNLEGPKTEVVYPDIIDCSRGEEMGITGLVNGLMCFYHRNYSYLYNMATRETLQLPLSNNVSQACSYHFGFDPVNKLYKLLKICPVYDGYDDDNQFAYDYAHFVCHLNCQILTIGLDSSWRIIDPPPPFEITRRGVWLGGLLCWMELIREESSDSEKRLISFDLAEETFQVIPLPGPPIDNDMFSIPSFGPSLVIFRARSFTSEKGGEVFMLGGWSGEMWTDDERKFTLETSYRSFLNAEGILPNGNMVIFEDDGSFLYLYDQSKGVLENIMVAPSKFDDYPFDLQESLYLEENIIPLSCLTLGT